MVLHNTNTDLNFLPSRVVAAICLRGAMRAFSGFGMFGNFETWGESASSHLHDLDAAIAAATLDGTSPEIAERSIVCADDAVDTALILFSENTIRFYSPSRRFYYPIYPDNSVGQRPLSNREQFWPSAS